MTQVRKMQVIDLPRDVTALADPAAGLPERERAELRAALLRLRRGRGLLVRVADLLGAGLSGAGGLASRGLAMTMRHASGPRLPSRLRGIAEAALARAFDLAVLGMEGRSAHSSSRLERALGDGRLARTAVTVSGAVGGLYGLAGFVPDAGFTTLAIMREIARIAREEGEDLSDEDARAACLQVFALGPREAEGESDLSYFSARLVLQGSPVVALLQQAATRYGLALSEKFAAQAVPVAGALCGAALNNAFMSHYRDLARAHFTIRRLERLRGTELVRGAAGEIEAELAGRAFP